MPPNFDTTVSTYLADEDQMASVNPATDFLALLHTIKNLDYTKVDKDAAQNVMNNAAQIVSKQTFDYAGQVVDRGLEWLAGGTAVAGQWYLTGAALVSEQLLDWAEKRFHDYMGWDQAQFTRGDWVVIDIGVRTNHFWGELEREHPEDVDRRRRRLPGLSIGDQLVSREAVYTGRAPSHKSSTLEIHNDVHLGLATGGIQVTSWNLCGRSGSAERKQRVPS